MSQAVLDTNVLASGFVRPNSVPGELLRRWAAGAFALIVSETILAELARTLRQPYFATSLTDAQADANIDLLRREAVVAPVTAVVRGIATHPEDDLILALVETVAAPYLVTGDRQLQRLGVHKGTQVVSPREFLDLLDAQERTTPPA